MTTQPSMIDLRSAGFRRDPWSAFARLPLEGAIHRRRAPLIGGVWMIATYDGVFEAAKDNVRFINDPNRAGGAIAWVTKLMPRSIRALGDNMLSRDEPDHRRLRRLVDQAFGQRGVESLRAPVAAATAELLDAAAHAAGPTGDRPVDLMAMLARPLPIRVIADLMGVPQSDRDDFARWARAVDADSSLIGTLGSLPRIMALSKYLRRQFEEVRARPRNDLMSTLVEIGEDEDKLSPDELLAMAFVLLIAGYATTTHLIGNSVWALLTHPAARAEFTSDWSGLGGALEELLRFRAPVQFASRFVGEDMTWRGAALRRGQLVLLCLAAANLDPARFEHPLRLDLRRAPNRHLSFGTGVHFCLGQQLARIEGRVALEQLFRRFPDIALADPSAPPSWGRRLGLQGVVKLEVRLGRDRGI